MFKKVLKNILDIFCFVLAAFLLVSIFSFIIGRKNPDYVPKLAGYKFMYVLTGSMSPSVKAGDMIVTRTVDVKDLKEGDIITFRTVDNTLITHRILRVNEDGSFITKGDSNNVEDIDLKAHRENIVGRYFFKIPKGGYIIKFIQSPIGLIIFIFIPAIMLIWGEIRSYNKELKTREKEKKIKGLK